MRDSIVAVVDEVVGSATGGRRALVCRRGGADFRAALGDVHPADDTRVNLSAECARKLGVNRGDEIRYVVRDPR